MCVAVFIPGRHRNDLAILKEVGCDDLFDLIASPMYADISGGPGGVAGKLICSSRAPQVSSYHPDAQEWFECGEYWLGFWKHAKPTPDMLAREQIFDGKQVLLRDGNLWTIPIGDLMPRRLTLDRSTGEEVRVPSHEHVEYVARCNELFAYFLSDDFQTRVAEEYVVHIEGGLTFASQALAKNYRVNRDLVDHLGLIDEHSAFDVACVACGLAMVDSVAAACNVH